MPCDRRRAAPWSTRRRRRRRRSPRRTTPDVAARIARRQRSVSSAPECTGMTIETVGFVEHRQFQRRATTARPGPRRPSSAGAATDGPEHGADDPRGEPRRPARAVELAAGALEQSARSPTRARAPALPRPPRGRRARDRAPRRVSGQLARQACRAGRAGCHLDERRSMRAFVAACRSLSPFDRLKRHGRARFRARRSAACIVRTSSAPRRSAARWSSSPKSDSVESCTNSGSASAEATAST